MAEHSDPTAGDASLRIAIDIGGTFTDAIAETQKGGRIWVAKCLTTPEDPGQAITTVVRDLLRQVAAAREPPAPAIVSEVVHGTTLVTNALIERNGAKTALILTRGTRDVLNIGREVRYDLYDLGLVKVDPLVPVERRYEVDERVDVHGCEIASLDCDSVRQILTEIARSDVDAVAICFLHSYANDSHERETRRFAREIAPNVAVSLSSGVAREVREYERMSTTVANAYVQPLMNRYVNRLEERIRHLDIAAPLRIMVSSGGFTSTSVAAEIPILLLESGPAGGVLSAINTAREANVSDLLTFDMGGTTAKACVVIAGESSLSHSFEAARVHRFKRGSGMPILIPSIDLVEIGAGGGSIAKLNKLGLVNVGPESAGAVPGPACYGRGGSEPTVTDADLTLGYLDARTFLGGEMPLREDLALAALDTLGKRIGMTAEETAWGICNIVDENMAAAARMHIAEKGHDPRRLTLVATGGAGPLHAVHVAHKLGIRRVLVTIAPGAGSCLGLLAAPARVDRAWPHVAVLSELDWSTVAETLQGLHEQATDELAKAGADVATVEWTLSVEMRYLGQGHCVSVDVPYGAVGVDIFRQLKSGFEQRYRFLYGRLIERGDIQTVTWRLTGRSRTEGHVFSFGDSRVKFARENARRHRRVFLPLAGRFDDVEVFARYSLPPGTTLRGPAILEERESTLVIPLAADVEILPNLSVSVCLGAVQ